MIIGNGDIASAIPDRPDRLFFAAGVSNSAETSILAFAREFGLLNSQDRRQHLVYFSSLCVFYSHTPYADYKRGVECFIRDQWPRYCIIRLGNITWGSNPHTLINYMRARYISCEPVEIRDEWRYIVDRDEFQYWLGMIPPWSCEMNVPGRRMKVADIYQEFVVNALERA